MLKIDSNKTKISWWDVDDLVKELCDKIIKDFPNIDSICGIPRGGLIPAVLISHRLSLPYTTNVFLPTISV